MTFLYILAAIGLVGLAWRLAQLGQGARATPARTTGAPETVESLLAAGNTIGAIKRLREETGLGLAEAKAAIDARKGGLRLPTGTHPPIPPPWPPIPCCATSSMPATSSPRSGATGNSRGSGSRNRRRRSSAS